MRDNRVGVLLAGMGIGAAAGLLFARYSGAEFRKQIGDKADDAKAYLKDQAGAAADRVGKAADDIDHHLAKSKDAIRDVSNKAKDVLDAAAATTDKLVDQSRAAASTAAKMVEKHAQRVQNI